MVSFVPFQVVVTEGEAPPCCSICLNDLVELDQSGKLKPAVAHTDVVRHGEQNRIERLVGSKHPYHLNCIKPWLELGKTNCPCCKIEIDPFSLLPPRSIRTTNLRLKTIAMKIFNFILTSTTLAGAITGGLIGGVIGGVLGAAASIVKITVKATRTELGIRIAETIKPILIMQKALNIGVNIGAMTSTGYLLGAAAGALLGFTIGIAIAITVAKTAAEVILIIKITEIYLVSIGLAVGGMGAFRLGGSFEINGRSNPARAYLATSFSTFRENRL